MVNMFLGTTPISISEKFLIVLKELIKVDSIKQKDLEEITGIDKTTISEAISDLRRLGWCKNSVEINQEVCIRKTRINEINLFLGGWNSLIKTILVRPHDIILQGSIKYDNVQLGKALTSLSKREDVKLVISFMTNNTQYTLKTQHGSIIVYQHGNVVKFCIEGFILPLNPEDIIYLEDYILKGINTRFDNLCHILEPVLNQNKIVINHAYMLKEIHLGLLTKKNASRFLLTREIMKRIGLFSDKSIYNCDEIEGKGKLDEVVGKISAFINTCMEAKVDFTEGKHIQE